MNFYRWELTESLQRVCDWGFHELVTPFHAEQCRAMNIALVFVTFSDIILQTFMHFNLTLMRKKNVPVLISRR